MSPSDLSVLIHCYCMPGPHPGAHVPAAKELIEAWLRDGIIQPYKDYYSTTERGNVWMQLILKTPMPIEKWIDPRKENEYAVR